MPIKSVQPVKNNIFYELINVDIKLSESKGYSSNAFLLVNTM